MNRIISAIVLLFLPIAVGGQNPTNTTQNHRYAPQNSGVAIINAHYCLDFNTRHKQPNWVCYALTQTNITGETPRSASFKNCRQSTIASATNNDYKGSGYDKGHLCPAADMKHSREAMAATFQMWNISPQEPSFNRGRWADLEELVRGYVESPADTIFVVTGPVFLCNKGSIGEGVTVPGLYYKVVFCPRRGGMAFLLPNQKCPAPPRSWRVSIDLVEALSGIDFFPQLPDEIENAIEAQVDWWE